MNPDAPSESTSIASIPQVMLEVLRGRARHRLRPVGPPVFLIGRANDCDLVLGDPQFPDLHTYLFVTEAGVMARYLGHGPEFEVNGIPRESTELGDGSVIRMGTYEFKIHIKTPSRHDGRNRRLDGPSAHEATRQAMSQTVADQSSQIAYAVQAKAELSNGEPRLRIYCGPQPRASRRISA